MANEIHVDVLKPEFRDSQIKIQARLRGHPRRRKRNGIILFELPGHTFDWLSVQGRADDIHDAFLRASIWSAMEAGCNLYIHGRVSQSLLRNLERYQQIVCRWWPSYHCVEIFADEEVSDDEDAAPASARQDAVLAFSGGLDSVESLVAHKLGKRRRNTIDIGAAVFVHGFDIPCDDPAFAAAFQRAKRITDQFDTELIQVRSNLKQLLPSWTTTFSAAVSAVLSLLEWRFSAGLIAASIAYENMHWVASHDGSTPLTDGLLSSTRFLVVPDLARTRVEKTSTLADCGIWPHLRVCWQGDEASTNCGTCEKCVRQMLCMMASGLHDFSAFETPLTPESVLATELPMEVVTEEWNACYDYACTRGLTDQPTFVAMKEVLDRTAFGAEAGPVRDAKGRSNLLFHPWKLVRHLLGS